MNCSVLTRAQLSAVEIGTLFSSEYIRNLKFEHEGFLISKHVMRYILYQTNRYIHVLRVQ